MTQRTSKPSYTAEFRERGVRLFSEQRGGYNSNNAAYQAIGSKLGCSPDSLRAWCQQAERDSGKLSGLTTDDRARLKELERENRELRQANEILKKASAYFAHPPSDVNITCRAMGGSSTARSANDRVYRQPQRSIWYRAYLQGVANSTINLSCTCFHCP